MDKWPEDLREDMKEVFKSSPEFLDILKEEKEFEDLMNRRSFEEYSKSPEDKAISPNGKKDKGSVK